MKEDSLWFQNNPLATGLQAIFVFRFQNSRGATVCYDGWIFSSIGIHFMASRYPKSKIRIGVSSCLLGEKVRWDGGHKRDRTLIVQLGRLFEWVPTCPEVEIGMGIPRESVQLTGNLKSPRMVGTDTETDWTARMHRYSKKRSIELAAMGVCGYLFKSRSPSCGIAGIPVRSQNGTIANRGRGLLADLFMQKNPLVPVEDEERLQDAPVRENFITRVFAYHRLTVLLSGRLSHRKLLEFHTTYQFLLLSHSRKHYDALEKMLLGAGPIQLKHFCLTVPLTSPARVLKSPAAVRRLMRRYAETFMQALTYQPTVRKNADALKHMLRFFGKPLTEAERKRVVEGIEGYCNGSTTLTKVVTLIKRYARKYKIDTLAGQTLFS